jgi:hypothetical protein
MKAFIPSITLFETQQLYHCAGVAAYENKTAAENKTRRIKHTTAKAQYFSVSIPEPATFIDISLPMSRQQDGVRHTILSVDALSLLFYAEGKIFMRNLGIYLDQNKLYDDPSAAQTEIDLFYEKKKNQITALSATGYLSLVENLAKNHNPAIVSSYLSQFHISGLVIQGNGTNGKAGNRLFLLFNPRKDIVIHEIIRIKNRESQEA